MSKYVLDTNLLIAAIRLEPKALQALSRLQSPETQDAQDAPNPNCVYVGTFNGYRCYVEDPEAVAQAIQRAIYRLAEEAEKEGAA